MVDVVQKVMNASSEFFDSRKIYFHVYLQEENPFLLTSFWNQWLKHYLYIDEEIENSTNQLL